jgi:hypothetical protein
LRVHVPKGDAASGLPILFPPATPNGPPVTYRIRVVRRVPKGSVGKDGYAAAAVEAAAATLAAVGIDPERPYSPRVLAGLLGTTTTRDLLFANLKASLARRRVIPNAPAVRALAITKMPTKKKKHP